MKNPIVKSNKSESSDISKLLHFVSCVIYVAFSAQILPFWYFFHFDDQIHVHIFTTTCVPFGVCEQIYIIYSMNDSWDAVDEHSDAFVTNISCEILLVTLHVRPPCFSYIKTQLQKFSSFFCFALLAMRSQVLATPITFLNKYSHSICTSWIEINLSFTSNSIFLAMHAHAQTHTHTV